MLIFSKSVVDQFGTIVDIETCEGNSNFAQCRAEFQSVLDQEWDYENECFLPLKPKPKPNMCQIIHHNFGSIFEHTPTVKDFYDPDYDEYWEWRGFIINSRYTCSFIKKLARNAQMHGE